MRYTPEQRKAAKRIRRVCTKAEKDMRKMLETLREVADLAYLHGFVNAGENIGYGVHHITNGLQGIELESDATCASCGSRTDGGAYCLKCQG